MHAYDAALTLCTIALRACGYQVGKGYSHHKLSIESLPLTIGAKLQGTSDQISVASRNRSQALYDRSGVVDARDATDLVETARTLRSAIVAWLAETHSNLLP